MHDCTLFIRFHALSVVCTLTLLGSISVSADEDSDAIPFGLLAKYTSELDNIKHPAVERIDPELSFDWGSAAPDERLPAGPFRAEWSGNLLARRRGKHRFHAFLAGRGSVSIDGTMVLQATQTWGFVSGREIELSAGDHDIRVVYHTPSESDKPRARLALFWSSDQFTLEPIPPEILTHDDETDIGALGKGRQLMDSLRCSACHQDNSGLIPLKAPALDRLRGSQSREMLVQRIRDPQSVVPNSHMPSFGFTQEEAEAAADYLLSVSKDPFEVRAGEFKEGDVSAGSRLLNSLGCAACHRLPDGFKKRNPQASPFEGPDLVDIGNRRSEAWLDRWLRTPADLNADHRMPVFELSKDERRQLTAVLSSTGGENRKTPQAARASEARVTKGRSLIMSSGCAACHSIPNVQTLPVPALHASRLSDSRPHCLRSLSDGAVTNEVGTRLPAWQLTESETRTVRNWIATTHHAGPLSPSDRGRRLLARNGCLACHDRNSSRGLSAVSAILQNRHSELSGQSQALVPPSLTAAGDKLNSDFLRLAVAGEQKERRLPWLLVRMPKFRHTDAERAALVQHLVTSDRIPDEADEARQDVLAHIDLTGKEKADAADLLLGNQLTGARGFNCVACHRAGPFEPRNVAPGTRGSDIMTMGRRIRPRFFQRWMKNPIRVVRGIEMPALKKGIPNVLDGSLPAQIGAVWKALSDDRFLPPTVTSRFEQVVNAEPGGSPRIIRDVFTIGLDRNREAVARAMAIGFGNGHNLLIDLDTMNIRLWTIGEFARQRTEGKSWYWDMPGTIVQQNTADTPPFVLLSTADEMLTPLTDESRTAELLSYRLIDGTVELDCRWRFTTEGAVKPSTSEQPHFTRTTWQLHEEIADRVVTRHRFAAVEDNAGQLGSGWTHSVSVLEAPAGSSLTGWLGMDRFPSASSDVADTARSISYTATPAGIMSLTRGETRAITLSIRTELTDVVARQDQPEVSLSPDTITSTPGFTGTRLPIPGSTMPTALAWLPDGRLAFTSLKGHVWTATDTDQDNVPDQLALFEEGLAAPFGILADPDSIIVSHKPEILRLRDTDGDGRADEREVVAAGWGFNDNYHDWAAGLVRDEEGNLFVGLGSDYSQKDRPASKDRWRGGVIKIDPSGFVTPLGMSMRYPMGLTFDRHGNLFATDNQGSQNTFNEINHILPGKHYGVPSRHQPAEGIKHEAPALMVPHPWTRSVNSILFLPEDFPVKEIRGHGIGCEYDSRFLIRFTVQNVDGILQGASYRFSLPNQEAGGSNFIGPICAAVAPDGSLYIGSIWDSGWQGGQNTGGITRLVPSPNRLPNGIRELTALKDGFEVEFFQPVASELSENPDNWSVIGYTRKWGGSYSTPDSGRYTLTPEQVQVLDDGRRVRILVPQLKSGYLYEVATRGALADTQLWPSEAHYSMKVVPQ